MEHPVLKEINHTGYPRELQGLENVIAQNECCGIDFYGFEILEDDEIAIDKENFEEVILKEHLKRYLIERCRFLYKAGIYVDLDHEEIIAEEDIEMYLSESLGFQFMQAK